MIILNLLVLIIAASNYGNNGCLHLSGQQSLLFMTFDMHLLFVVQNCIISLEYNTCNGSTQVLNGYRSVEILDMHVCIGASVSIGCLCRKVNSRGFS